MKLLTLALMAAVPFFISGCISCSHHVEYNSGKTTISDQSVAAIDSVDVKNDTLKRDFPTIGKVLKTRGFDFKVDKIKVTDNVDIVKGALNVEAEKGFRFIVLSLTVKNNDKANFKDFHNGELWVLQNNKKYNMTTTETIKFETGESDSENRVPGQTRLITLYYKIPKTMTGTAYFLPFPSNGNERISLGNL